MWILNHKSRLTFHNIKHMNFSSILFLFICNLMCSWSPAYIKIEIKSCLFLPDYFSVWKHLHDMFLTYASESVSSIRMINIPERKIAGRNETSILLSNGNRAKWNTVTFFLFILAKKRCLELWFWILALDAKRSKWTSKLILSIAKTCELSYYEYIGEHLMDAFQYILEVMNEKGHVLIHCDHLIRVFFQSIIWGRQGISRSVIIWMCFCHLFLLFLRQRF